MTPKHLDTLTNQIRARLRRYDDDTVRMFLEMALRWARMAQEAFEQGCVETARTRMHIAQDDLDAALRLHRKLKTIGA